MFISVDLPAPFSPSSACTSPAPQIEVDAVVRDDPGEALRDPAQLEDGRASAMGARFYGGARDEGGRGRPLEPDSLDEPRALHGGLILPLMMSGFRRVHLRDERLRDLRADLADVLRRCSSG